jgi:hypothetical protein
MKPKNENQAIVDRIAHLQKTAGSTKSGAISQAFRRKINYSSGWYHEALKRVEDMGLLKMSSHRGNETASYKLTAKGWAMAGGAPLWFMDDAA